MNEKLGDGLGWCEVYKCDLVVWCKVLWFVLLA
jgi:hypothetical protein